MADREELAEREELYEFMAELDIGDMADCIE
jgi:hypothetical protein